MLSTHAGSPQAYHAVECRALRGCGGGVVREGLCWLIFSDLVFLVYWRVSLEILHRYQHSGC